MMSHPRRYAFFDLDGTLITEASMLSFQRFRLEREQPATASQRWQSFLQEAAQLRQAGVPREQQNVFYYRSCFASVRIDRVVELAEQWFETRRTDSGFWKPELIAHLQRHRAQGTEPVLVTGSFREIAQLIAEQLGGAVALSAPLIERDGYYTGELSAPPTIGPGKVRAIEAWVGDAPDVLAASFGYGDDESDIPFLERLGFPHAVGSGTAGLLAHAAQRGWPVCHPA